MSISSPCGLCAASSRVGNGRDGLDGLEGRLRRILPDLRLCHGGGEHEKEPKARRHDTTENEHDGDGRQLVGEEVSAATEEGTRARGEEAS